MKKKCFITKTNKRTGRISKLYRIYETKTEAEKNAKEMRREERMWKREFPEWQDTYKYEVREMEKDHELFERLEKEHQKHVNYMRSFARFMCINSKSIAEYVAKTALRNLAKRRQQQTNE